MLLHRHQLARAGAAGWRAVLDRPWDAEARQCLQTWAAHDWPLVVTRQPLQGWVPGDASASGPMAPPRLALGLAAPQRWSRRRLTIEISRSQVSGFDEFPRADALAAALPAAARVCWLQLCAALTAIGAVARVYGSHGWQLITGLECVRAGSDIDLWLAVRDAAQADAAVALLGAAAHPALPRLDGELLFDDGRAVAWREWLVWRRGPACLAQRAGRTGSDHHGEPFARSRDSILVKGLAVVWLCRDWSEPAPVEEMPC